jgi:hypothetical protein
VYYLDYILKNTLFIIIIIDYMVYYGTGGTLCMYYKGLLISSYPLTNKKTIEAYLYQGEELIYKSKHIPIKLQIKTYLHFCNMIYRRKKNKEAIFKSDHINFLNCLTALLRLRIIDNDDENGYMAFQKKSK